MDRARLPQIFAITMLVIGLGPAAGYSAEGPASQATPKKPRPQQAVREKRVQNRMLRQSVAVADKTTPAVSGDQTKSEAENSAKREAADPAQVAARVDKLITAELQQAGIDVAPICNDETFLRRVSLDIAGVPPSVSELTLFALDPSSQKRSAAVGRLLTSGSYARNWSRYWHDVVATRATETRPQFLIPSLAAFDQWIEKQLAANRPWNEIATDLMTATGDSRTEGQTALIISQRAEPDDIATEVSRLFLGIQLQCANCHDHPTDSWKREQFHSLAAFFPRIQVRPKGELQSRTQSLELVSFTPPSGNGRGGRPGDFLRGIRENPSLFIRRLDKNGDRQVSREEVQQAPNPQQAERLFDLGDSNKDGLLTADELKKLPDPPMNLPGRGAAEYLMPDPQEPNSTGQKLDPVFFLGGVSPGSGLPDLDRRQSLARYVTAPTNPWFAKAFVNRIWATLVGEGFYMPIDDIGPERTARHAAALEELSREFIASGYDIAWLFQTITGTATYQRQTRPRDPNQSLPFAAAIPTRLRADLLYDSLAHVLGFQEPEPVAEAEGEMMQAAQMIRRQNSPRAVFHQTFAFDPSTTPDEINGTIPQALLLMNNAEINRLMRASGNTRLRQILDKFPDNTAAIRELFLLVHSREPSAHEAATCRDYLDRVSNRQEAFEDVLWSLLNSTEFQTKH
ncbi:MAG: DUF1549 domain-containing protein [Planctomycetes bacterium]|nr:DUF1549 domain-containing protein [Planctomycetota bacterium]